MSEIVRFGVSLDNALLGRYDNLIRRKNYRNRSEAIRELIRHSLSNKNYEGDGEVAGAIIYIYDKRQRDLVNRIIDVQHDYRDIMQLSQHMHLNNNDCIEIVAVKGLFSKVCKFSDSLKALKGVRHGSLSASRTGKIK